MTTGGSADGKGMPDTQSAGFISWPPKEVGSSIPFLKEDLFSGAET